MPRVAEKAGKTDFLKRVSWFQDLDQRSLDAIANSAVEQNYEPGQEIVRQGDTGVGAFIIRSGKVEIIQEKDGKQSKIATLGPGDVIGASSAGISRGSSKATRSSRSRSSRSCRAASVRRKASSRTRPRATSAARFSAPLGFGRACARRVRAEHQ